MTNHRNASTASTCSSFPQPAPLGPLALLPAQVSTYRPWDCSLPCPALVHLPLPKIIFPKKESADAFTWPSCTGTALCHTRSVDHFGSCWSSHNLRIVGTSKVMPTSGLSWDGVCIRRLHATSVDSLLERQFLKSTFLKQYLADKMYSGCLTSFWRWGPFVQSLRRARFSKGQVWAG